MHLRRFTLCRGGFARRGRFFEDGVGDQFGQVLDQRTRFDHAFEHRRALWTTHGNQFGGGLADVVHAHVGDTLFARNIGNRRTAATAAAARAEARTLHLLDLNAEGAQYFARRLVLAVVAAQVARVVIGHAAALVLAEVERASGNQFGDIGAVVLHQVVAAEGTVLVLEHMEAVRVAGDDALEAVLGHGLDIALGQLLEGRFVAQAPGHVTAVALFQAEHGKVYLRSFQHFDKSPQGALVTHVKGTIADPEQYFGGLDVTEQVEVEVRRPVHPPTRGEAARVVGGDQVVQHLGALVRRRAFFQGQVATHVDDGIDVLDHHRAFLDAGAAGGARPQGLGIDQAVDDRLMRVAAMLADRLARVRAAGKLGIGAAGQANDHVLDEFFRVQRLACGKRRAHGLALAALYAGVKAEQLVPGEILGLFYPQQRLRVLKVDGFEPGRTATAKALGAPVPGQVQGTGEGVLHRPAPGHAEEQLGHAPQHANPQQRHQQPAAEALRENPGHRQGGDEEARGKHQQAFRQAHPRAFRQPCWRVEAAFVDEQRTAEHQHGGEQQGKPKDLVMQAKAMHQNRQHRCQDEAASRGHVSVGHVLVAGDHVVQVDHIAPWHGQQAAQQIDLRRPTLAPHPHAPQRAEDGKAQGGEQEDGDKGVQHQRHLSGASLKPQAASKGNTALLLLTA
ncbi:hypothetical protein EMIT053CA3_70034 [Pseudomonas donghuensis]